MNQLYTLFLTEECNYNCDYCEHINKKGMMSKEVFDDLFKESLKKTKKDELISFTLFGGEPILNFELVEYILNKCNAIKNRRNISINMTTNLSLLDDRMKKTYKKYEDIISIDISLDGPKDIFEQKKKGGNFENVIKNYEWIKNNTKIKLGVSAVIDKEYLNKTYDNIKFLYSLGFRNFSIYLNLDDLGFTKKYRENLSKELDKINNFIIDHLDEIEKIKLERYRLDEPGYINDIVCDLEDASYVGTTGKKFNCTRYKYAKGERNHEHVNWNKCNKCKYEAYCCNCWGNDSFLYENIDGPKKKIQANYCKLIKMMIEKAFKHWERLKEIKKETKVMKYIKKGETLPLLVNPKKIDIKENAVILVDSIPDFELETNAKIKMMIEISINNVSKLYNIVLEGLKKNIYHFQFRFKDTAGWSDKNLNEYDKQLNKIIDLMQKEGVFHINVIDDILYQNNNFFNEKFIENEISYLDPSLKNKYEDIDEGFFNGELEPICKGCKLGHCQFDPVYNKKITNESIVPTIQQCSIGKIDGKAALRFYEMIKK